MGVSVATTKRKRCWVVFLEKGPFEWQYLPETLGLPVNLEATLYVEFFPASFSTRDHFPGGREDVFFAEVNVDLSPFEYALVDLTLPTVVFAKTVLGK